MEPVSTEMASLQLQLLAINALFEQAQQGTSGDASCVRSLQEMLKLGSQLVSDPYSVRRQDLEDVQRGGSVRLDGIY